MVCQRIGFQVAPHVFDGIEFRGVGGKVFQGDSRFGGKVSRHSLRPMGVQPIPDGDGPTWQMPIELAEKVSDERSFDGHMGMKAEEQPHAVTLWGDDQGGNGGNLLVRPSALQENRCLSAWRPGAAHQGGHQEAAFINKHPIGIQETGFF